MQTCRKCEEVKPINEFHFRNDSRKHRTDCKSCRALAEILRRYRITKQQLEKLVQDADNRCMICEVHFDDLNHATFKYSPLVVDHNHETGSVRGLLCPTCNSGLGHFKDSPDLLTKAAQYIKEKDKI